MTQLTKEQRNNNYIAALKMLIRDKERGYLPRVCTYLGTTAQNWNNDWLKNNYPEFFKHEPKIKYVLGWFPNEDYETRIKILTQCIEETKP